MAKRIQYVQNNTSQPWSTANNFDLSSKVSGCVITLATSALLSGVGAKGAVRLDKLTTWWPSSSNLFAK